MGNYLVSLMSKMTGLNAYSLTEGMIGFFGWLNVLLAMIAVSVFTLRRVNKRFYANKHALIKNLLKPLAKFHPYVGGALLFFGYLHGDLALPRSVFRAHTGPLIWWILLAMLLVATLGKTYKLKHWLVIHRALAGTCVVAIFLHLFFRNLL